MFSKFCCISAFCKNIIFFIIFICQRINITLRHPCHSFCNFINWISIYFPAEFNLRFHFITFCYSYISHIICNTHNTDMAAFNYANSCSHPGSNFFLNMFICPVSHNYFSFHIQTAENMSIFSVSMGCLIFIHKIHIDCFIRNFTIKLCMQMKQWFSELLQS